MCFKTFSKAPVEQRTVQKKNCTKEEQKQFLLVLGELLIAPKDNHFFLSNLPKSSHQ